VVTTNRDLMYVYTHVYFVCMPYVFSIMLENMDHLG